MHWAGVALSDSGFFFRQIESTPGGSKRHRHPANVFAFRANRVAGCRTHGKLLHFARFTKGFLPFFFCLFDCRPRDDRASLARQRFLWQVFFPHSKLHWTLVSMYAVATNRLQLCPSFYIFTIAAAVDITEAKFIDCGKMFFSAVAFVLFKKIFRIFFRNLFHKPIAFNLCRN